MSGNPNTTNTYQIPSKSKIPILPRKVEYFLGFGSWDLLLVL
jgi:hypothetical protein